MAVSEPELQAVRAIAVKSVPNLGRLAPLCLCDGKEIEVTLQDLAPGLKASPATRSVPFSGNLIRETEKSMWLKQTLALLVRLEMSQWERNASGRVF